MSTKDESFDLIDDHEYDSVPLEHAFTMYVCNKEVAQDAKRWAYVRDHLAQKQCEVNGEYAWTFWTLLNVTGRTLAEAVDRAIEQSERERLEK